MYALHSNLPTSFFNYRNTTLWGLLLINQAGVEIFITPAISLYFSPLGASHMDDINP